MKYESLLPSGNDSDVLDKAIRKQQRQAVKAMASKVSGRVAQAQDVYAQAKQQLAQAEATLKKMEKALKKYRKSGNVKHLEIFGV